MKKGPFKIHPDFRLDGVAYDSKTLVEFALRYIEEGSESEKSIGAFLMDWLNDQLSISVRTSGSTGDPKPISLEKRHMVNSALATAEFFGLSAGTTALLCLSADTIAGKMMLVRAMVLGWLLDTTVPTSSPLKGLMKTYDFCAMVPLQLRKSLELVDCINTLIVGGAPIAKDLKNRLSNKDVEVYETFGMTETVSHIALKPVFKNQPKYKTALSETFKTLAGITVSTDERGCLVVDAPGIAKNPIITNDLVQLISTTEFIWLGRWDHIINSGGVKLIPEHIEEKISPLIKSRYILTSLPDDNLGEKLILVIESDEPDPTLRKRLSNIEATHPYEIPKSIFTLGKFPETPGGKPDRRGIKDLIMARSNDE